MKKKIPTRFRSKSSRYTTFHERVFLSRKPAHSCASVSRFDKQRFFHAFRQKSDTVKNFDVQFVLGEMYLESGAEPTMRQ